MKNVVKMKLLGGTLATVGLSIMLAALSLPPAYASTGCTTNCCAKNGACAPATCTCANVSAVICATGLPWECS